MNVTATHLSCMLEAGIARWWNRASEHTGILAYTLEYVGTCMATYIGPKIALQHALNHALEQALEDTSEHALQHLLEHALEHHEIYKGPSTLLTQGWKARGR